MRAPDDLEVARVVLHAERDVVAGRQAEVAEELRHRLAIVVELAEGHHLARAAHDDGGLVGIGRRVHAGEHGSEGTRVRCAPMQPSQRFADLMEQPAASVPLDEAAFLIAAHAHPGLDVAAQLGPPG